MAAFVTDTFTDTNGVNLTAHTGETGATWAKMSGYTPDLLIDTNRVRGNASGNAGYYASGSPSSADYSVTAKFRQFTAPDEAAAVAARVSTSAATFYMVYYNPGNSVIRLYKSVAGSFTQLGSNVTYSAGNGNDFWLKIDVTGTTITAYTSPDGSTFTQRVQVTDSSITAAGKAGLWITGTGASSVGCHCDSISADDPSATATTATLSGPTSGTVNVASTNFTVALDGSYTGTITPATGGTGTFSPTSLSGAGTFTYTPTTTSGSPHAISITASPSLSYSGSPINYTVNAGPVTIAVTDSNLFFSPYNWKLSGSTYAQSNTPGAYLKIKFTGTSVKLNVDVTPLSGASVSAGNYPAIYYSVDGAAWTRTQLASGNTQLTLATGLASGTHSLIVIMDGSWYANDRWTTPVQVLRVTGLEVDAGAASASQTLYSGRMIVYGDSNGEGYEATTHGVSVANQAASLAFPLLIGRALECEVGVVCFAAQGYITAPGSGSNVPKLYDSGSPSTSGWLNYYASTSRLSAGLFDPAPDYIVSCHGQNDGSSPQSAVQSLIGLWRTAAPSAKIAICSPSSLNWATELAAAVTAAADSNAKYVTTGEVLLLSTWSSGASQQWTNANHLSYRGHSRYAASLIAGIKTAFATGGGLAYPVGRPI